MKISGVKFEVNVNVACGEFKDEKELCKELNIGAHMNVELGEAEVSPDETLELIHSAMDIVHAELADKYEHRRVVETDAHINDLRKEINKKEEEVKMLRGAVETQRVELSYLKGQMGR